MSTEPSSLEKSIRAVTGESLTAGMEPEQLDLLRDGRGKLPADVFQRMRVQARGRGRPVGARNKRTDDLARLIAQQHGDPVMFMASLYSTPLDQLIELMIIADPGTKSAKKGDIVAKALAVQLQAAKAVAEYTHSKKPVEVTATLAVDGVLVMPAASAIGGGPVQQVLQNITDAVNSGQVDPSQIADLRIVEGEFDPVGDLDDEDDDDE